jgi:hypothetical protein
METIKDPDRFHDMKLQGVLALKVYEKIYPTAEKISRSVAMREWTAGENQHCLSDYYREVLQREKKEPKQIQLDDEKELEHLVDEILSMKNSDTIH